MKNYRVLLFYKYVKVENPVKIVKEHLDWCLANEIKGRIFIAEEGVNGTVSATIENIEKYKSHLTSYPMFNDIWFKEDDADEHAFRKMHVRFKNEIVNSALNHTSLKNGGKRLSPKKLKQFYDIGKDFIIVDARNKYESEIGRFKNAITPSMKNFRGWKQAVKELKEHKNKTVVTLIWLSRDLKMYINWMAVYTTLSINSPIHIGKAECLSLMNEELLQPILRKN